VTQDIWLLVLAGLLIVFGGFFAGAEAALSRVSRVTADELERAGRRGAARLQQVVADPARYLNVLALLRVACEIVATVLVTVVCLDRFSATWQAVLVAGGVMVVVSYVAVGVSPRTIGRQHAARVALAGHERIAGNEVVTEAGHHGVLHRRRLVEFR
jgi:Mg2+/Co2+ transporter CorB